MVILVLLQAMQMKISIKLLQSSEIFLNVSCKTVTATDINEKLADGSILPSWGIHFISNLFSGMLSLFSIL